MPGGRSRLEVGRWLSFNHHHFHHRLFAARSCEMLITCQKPDCEGGHVNHLASAYDKVALADAQASYCPTTKVF